MLKYEEKVVPILKEAGAELLKHYGNVDADKKSDHPADLVTEMDKKTETFVAEKLNDFFPEIDFYGEEHGGNKEAERFWLLDPIDGTAHYVRGNPYCTTMLALIEDGRPVFSAIYNFVTKDMYLAGRGQGATKNGEKITVSSRSLQESYLAYEIDTSKGKNEEAFLAMDQDLVLCNTISAGYEFLLVAEGKLDGRIMLDAFGDIYDFPQGALLVEEAGGVVKNLGSDNYDYTNFTFTATNPRVYQELQQKDYWQKRVEFEKRKKWLSRNR